MGRFVFGDIPKLDELVEKASAGIGRDIESLRVPRLAGVVLGPTASSSSRTISISSPSPRRAKATRRRTR